jgi:hypothetical protein
MERPLWFNERYIMWIGLVILSYVLCVFLLIRFFQSVHHWDGEIELMENQYGHTGKKHKASYRPAA